MSLDAKRMAKFVNLSVSHEGTAVLQDVNLELERGQRYAVMGPSGSGKSTFLKILVGLNQPDAAFQYQCDLDFRAIAYLPQDSKDVVVPWQQVGKQCTVDDMKALGLEELERKWPSELSGGELRRLAIARVLQRSAQSDLIAMDEPLTGLDVDIRAQTIDYIVSKLDTAARPASPAGPLFVFVTHYVEEALALATRKLEVKNHKIHEGPLA